jgi:phosphate-selective porin OprO/OprP
MAEEKIMSVFQWGIRIALISALFVLGTSVLLAEETNTTAPSAGYKKGFFIQSADGMFKMAINGRVQARYTYESVDGLGEGEDDKTFFSIPRARLTLKGHAFSKDITYKFQSDFGEGAVNLKDFFVDYAFSKNSVHLRVGQWKKPFSRQQINSSSKLALVDRPLTDKEFGAGRDIGIALHSNYGKTAGMEYTLGVFNGTGDKGWFSGSAEADGDANTDDNVTGKFTNVPDRFNPTIVARFGYNSEGMKGYSEADLEGGSLRYSIGLSTMADLILDDLGTSKMNNDLDFAVKANGFSTTGGFYLANGNADGIGEISAMGAHLMAGYVLNGKYQPVLRYTWYAPEDEGNDMNILTAGLSVYFLNHNLKWQTDVASIFEENADAYLGDMNLRIRSQLQLSF